MINYEFVKIITFDFFFTLNYLNPSNFTYMYILTEVRYLVTP